MIEMILGYIMEYAAVGAVVFSIASTTLAIVCLVQILRTRKEHRKKFAETKADTNSLKNEMERMRQSPPKLRIPFDERLKAEYEKRGI
jgi:hypothetical protein